MPKVYDDQYWPGAERAEDTRFVRPPYSHFTISKYNRVLTAIRFRQVRVKPTLPLCPRDVFGQLPEEHEIACTQQSVAFYNSCTTPLENHALSRPCWGRWTGALQDVEYPSAFQKETAEQAFNDSRPEYDLLCTENCRAYFERNLRHCDSYKAFCRGGVKDWVKSFHEPTLTDDKLVEGMARCVEACDVSGSTQLAYLSGFTARPNFGMEPDFCGAKKGKSSAFLQVTGGSGCWGDVVDLPLEKDEAFRLVAAMKRERWTNEGTRGVLVEMNVYNPNYDIATVLRLSVHVHAGGQFEPYVEMWSCRLFPYTSTTDTARLALEGSFTLFLVYYFLGEVVEFYQEREKYLRNFWNYIELLNLFIYLYTMTSWYNYISNPLLITFKKRSVGEFQDLYAIAKQFYFVGFVSSFNMLLGLMRFFKYFRLYTRFMMLWDTLHHAMGGVVPFMLVFALLTVAFVTSGRWLFGARVFLFHDFTEALGYLVLSITDGIDYGPLKDAQPGAAFLWFVCWHLISALVLVNFLIAIVTESFSAMKERAQLQASIEERALELQAEQGGPKMPSLLRFFLHDYCPHFLLPGSTRARHQHMEAHERVLELKETLAEVDVDKLWDRLLRGVSEKETAVDSIELKHLFNGSEKAARLFIDRVCHLGELERVGEDPVGDTKRHIESLGR